MPEYLKHRYRSGFGPFWGFIKLPFRLAPYPLDAILSPENTNSFVGTNILRTNLTLDPTPCSVLRGDKKGHRLSRLFRSARKHQAQMSVLLMVFLPENVPLL